MKHQSPTKWLTLTAGLALVALLASCRTYDPAFEAAKNSIPDTDYPASQIVGEWLNVRSGGRTAEAKFYLKLRQDGTGVSRRVLSYEGKKRAERTEDLRWTYLGQNRWSIASVPDSVRHQYGEGWWNPHLPDTSIVRLLPPRLYDFSSSSSFVPLGNKDLVRTIHQEQRSIPPEYHSAFRF